MSENKGVLIAGELLEGKLASITAELLGVGRKLADSLGQDLSAVIIGNGVKDFADEMVSLGADKVYVIDDAIFENYVTDSYVAAMEKLVKEIDPEVLLMGQTTMGRDLAPRLAFRLGTAVTLDCVGLEINADKVLEKTKPVYGGNALAVYVGGGEHPQMATVRTKAMDPTAPDTSRKGEVIAFDAGVDASVVRTKVIEKIKEEVEGIKLEDADVVVCGGRGMGSGEAFEPLTDLAKTLGGAMGGTRPPCDSGWIPAALQIGLTGKMVAPTVYIAVALSGSSQHQAGMSGSKNIIAINKDPEANIFGIAHYGVVGDYKKILPAFIDKCKELLAN